MMGGGRASRLWADPFNGISSVITYTITAAFSVTDEPIMATRNNITNSTLIPMITISEALKDDKIFH